MLLSGDHQHLKGLYGKWEVAKIGPEKSLGVPDQKSIVYHFNVNNTLTIESPYKNAQRKFHTKGQHINFNGLGLFGGYNKFVYSVSNNILTLKTEGDFVVRLKRV